MAEQATNKSNNVQLTCDGQTKTATEWAKIKGVTKQAIHARLRQGLTPAEALTKEFRSRRRST